MADTSKLMDWGWKISTLVLGVVIVPTAGWVWNMQNQMTSIKKDIEYATKERIEARADLEDIKKDVRGLENNVNSFTSTSTDVGWLKASLDALNNKLDRIETRLVNL